VPSNVSVLEEKLDAEAADALDDEAPNELAALP
jgi:hypothetical protein